MTWDLQREEGGREREGGEGGRRRGKKEGGWAVYEKP
jgi:hypothetical protein